MVQLKKSPLDNDNVSLPLVYVTEVDDPNINTATVIDPRGVASAPRAEDDDDDDYNEEQWKCTQCTLHNHIDLTYCEACEAERLALASTTNYYPHAAKAEVVSKDALPYEQQAVVTFVDGVYIPPPAQNPSVHSNNDLKPAASCSVSEISGDCRESSENNNGAVEVVEDTFGEDPNAKALRRRVRCKKRMVAAGVGGCVVGGVVAGAGLAVAGAAAAAYGAKQISKRQERKKDERTAQLRLAMMSSGKS